MKKIFFVLVILFVFSVAFFIPAGAEQITVFKMDKKFFTDFSRIPALQKDSILEEKLNTVILSSGVVESIDRVQRYKNSIRIKIVNKSSRGTGVGFVYYIFVKSQDSIPLLVEGQIFEFTGQFMAYTPVNSKRTSYIIDIVFEKGTVLIDEN